MKREREREREKEKEKWKKKCFQNKKGVSFFFTRGTS
jgi:hypothetical protein